MRIIYLKNLKSTFYNPYYYKIVEVSKEVSKKLTVTQDSVDVEDSEDFFDTVGFVKNTLCKHEGCEEISRAEFDAFFIKTTKKINELTIL